MNISLRYNSWPYFLCAAISLSFLSYGSFGSGTTLVIWLFGILLPFVGALWTAAPRPDSPAIWLDQEHHSPHGAWPFAMAGILGILARLYHLTTLTAWPSFDEAVDSFYSLELLNKGGFRFFYHFSQIPFFFNETLAVFYRIFTPSLFSLWLYPALLSILTLVLFYAAIRRIFSAGFSLLLFILAVFSFWHLELSRYCMSMVLMVFWEAMALTAAAYYFTLPEGPARRRSAWAMGWVAGTGFFVHPAWPAVVLFLLVALIGKTRKNGSQFPTGNLLRYLIPIGLSVLSLAAMALQDHIGGYIGSLWALNGTDSWRQHLSDSFCYLTTIFTQPGPSRVPWFVWGGLLDPLAGAMFWMGLLEMIRLKKTPFAQWLMASLFISFLPGLAAKGVEIYRIIALFPLLVIVMGLGAAALRRDSPSCFKTYCLCLLIAVSSFLSLYHLFGPYHRVFGIPNPQWALQKSEPFYRAYQILEKDFEPQGPGAVLTDLWSHSSDESLTLATYPFNTVRNPRFLPMNAHWVAVFADSNYKPFLARRFPKGRWFWLGPLQPLDRSGLMMGVISIGDSNRDALSRWIQADLDLQPATSLVMDRAPWASKQPVIELMRKVYLSMKGDPFLGSSFWEKIYVMEETDNDPKGMLAALERGLKNGYPLAHLYNEEGILLERMGRISEARLSFKKALQAPLNLTLAAENLKNLDKP